MQLRDLPFVKTHRDTLTRIVDGEDIWSVNTNLSAFVDLYRSRYAALPTNTQFTEREVKESSYVSLGQRGEKNRTVMSTARTRQMPDAMHKGMKLIAMDCDKKDCFKERSEQRR